MASGGARNRSGPQRDPNSLRSAKRGVVLRTLDASGFRGEAPAMPLPDASPRELELWGLKWRSPQACAWIEQPWRHYEVALYVWWAVRSEAEDASAAVAQAVMRYEDRLGISPAGLKENGWTIGEPPARLVSVPTPVEGEGSVTDIRSRFGAGE